MYFCIPVPSTEYDTVEQSTESILVIVPQQVRTTILVLSGSIRVAERKSGSSGMIGWWAGEEAEAPSAREER